MQTTNGALWDAYLALARVGEMDLPAVPIGFRLALNRNHLKPRIEAMDAARVSLAKQHGVLDSQKDSEVSAEDFHLRMEAFSREWTALRQETAEWESPGGVEIRKFAKVTAIKPNDLAVLMDMGIVYGSLNGGDPQKDGEE